MERKFQLSNQYVYREILLLCNMHVLVPYFISMCLTVLILALSGHLPSLPTSVVPVGPAMLNTSKSRRTVQTSTYKMRSINIHSSNIFISLLLKLALVIYSSNDRPRESRKTSQINRPIQFSKSEWDKKKRYRHCSAWYHIRLPLCCCMERGTVGSREKVFCFHWYIRGTIQIQTWIYVQFCVIIWGEPKLLTMYTQQTPNLKQTGNWKPSWMSIHARTALVKLTVYGHEKKFRLDHYRRIIL